MEREKEGFPITSLREVSTLLKVNLSKHYFSKCLRNLFSQAQHENIVTVREIVVGSNMDSIFMVMDYVEHDLKSLMEVLKSRKQYFLPGKFQNLELHPFTVSAVFIRRAGEMPSFAAIVSSSSSSRQLDFAS